MNREKTAGGEELLGIETAVARTSTLSTGSAIVGKLEALESANVVPKIAGKVASVAVDVGSEVKEGDLLVSLDAADLEALVELYAAQLEKARHSDLPSQKNQAELNLANAEAALKTAEADYLRAKQLLAASVISRQQYEQQEKAYTQAKAAYEAAQNALDILVNATIPDTIRQCEAQLKKAQADFANSIISAPISGIVTARNVNPGEMASPTQPVVTIVKLDPLVVKIDVSEDQINHLQVGQELKVKVGSVGSGPFTGVVSSISVAANPQTKGYEVKIKVPNPDRVLKPGMVAEVFVSTREEAGVVVPAKAVSKEEEKSYVWVVENGVVTKREVITGLTDGENIIIKEGLTDGEEVAVSKTESLKEGARIRKIC